MTAVISVTVGDPKYSFFVPLTIWAWKRIGVNAVVFFDGGINHVVKLWHTESGVDGTMFVSFGAEPHKAATYSQCSRLYAAALPDIPDDEVLITGDVDMLVFGEYLKTKTADFDIFGSDLTPEKQIPICYISAAAKYWRKAMQIDGRSYQECLDDLLGGIEAEHFRGNYWGKDQETAYQKISSSPCTIAHHFRAKPGTQFATHRLDRDDAYLLERLSLDTIDYHLPRPGYEENNFRQIMTVLKFMYPFDNFDWLEKYRQDFISFL